MIPIATEWATDEEVRALSVGRSLDPEEVGEAVSMGVAFPERVRLCVVTSMPKPNHALLLDAMKQTNFLGEGTVGLALGYAIFVLSGHETQNWLLRHEMRHVAQYEQAVSIGNFLTEYLDQVLSVGYLDAPLERDARRYEKPMGVTR